MTDFSNLTSNGMLVGGGLPATFGNAYYVDYRNGSDDNPGTEKDTPFKTYGKAVSTVATNNNDLILIDGDSTVVEASMVTLSKNRVHTIGLNGPAGHFGAGAKISQGVTTAATDVATVKVTGVRNTFTGLKIMNSNTVTNASYALLDAGEYSRYFNCEFFKSSLVAQAAAADVLGNGDSSMFYGSTFGNMSTSCTAAGARANVYFDREIVAGKVARDNYFENCLFQRMVGNAGNHFIANTAADDNERFVIFKDSTFIANPLSAATMTDAIDNNCTNAYFLLKECAVLGPTNVCADADTTTYIIGSSPTGTTAGLAVEASAA